MAAATPSGESREGALREGRHPQRLGRADYLRAPALGPVDVIRLKTQPATGSAPAAEHEDVAVRARAEVECCSHRCVGVVAPDPERATHVLQASVGVKRGVLDDVAHSPARAERRGRPLLGRESTSEHREGLELGVDHRWNAGICHGKAP